MRSDHPYAPGLLLANIALIHQVHPGWLLAFHTLGQLQHSFADRLPLRFPGQVGRQMELDG